MTEFVVPGFLTDFSQTQTFLEKVQFILFIVASPVIFGYFSQDVFSKDGLKCAIHKGKDDNINTICYKQYSEEYYWPVSLKNLALINWFLLLSTWLPLLFSPQKLQWLGVPKVLRTVILAAFVTLILTLKLTGRGLSFPDEFSCKFDNRTAAVLNMTSVLCPDKYSNEKTNMAILLLLMDVAFLILTLWDIFKVLFHQHSDKNRLREKILRSTQNQMKLFAADKFVLRFDNIFTELLVYGGRMFHALRQNDLYNREGNLWNYVTPDSKLNSVEDLVKPLKDEKVPPRNILVVGRAGIGKTMFSKKLIRGWAYKNSLWKRYDYVFLLNFRQLNSIKRDISLCQLLAASPHSLKLDKETFKDIVRYSGKVLVIFDGLDEFLNQDDCKEAAERLPGVGEDEAMPVPALYYKLCTGELLPQATIVTTTRGCKVLEIIDWDRTVEIMGFDKTQIEEFVRKFCQDPKISEAIIQHITSRPDLLAYCYIPVNCFLLCYCLRSVLETKESAKDSLPTTLTQLYELILRLFVSKHYQSRGEPVRVSTQGRFGDAALEEKIDLLSKVAYEGVKDRRLVFEEEAFEGFKELTSCGIIHEMQRIDTVAMECGPQFIFLHLTVQEFLAARHVVKKFTLEQFEAFISSAVNDSRWEVVLQFVAGLLSPSAKVQPEHTHVTSLRNEMFKHLKKIEERKQILLVKCLFEYHDVRYLKNEYSWEGEIELNLSGVK